MATPNTKLAAVADARSPLQKIFSSTNLVLFMVCLMYGLTYIDTINVNTAGPSIQRDLHINTVQMGWVFSAFGWAYLALQVWGGWLSDKFGARLTLTVCGIIWAGATICIGFVGSFVALIVCRVIYGAGRSEPAMVRGVVVLFP